MPSSQCSHRYNFLMFLPTCAPAHMCLPFPHAPSHMHLCDLRLPTCPHPSALTGITFSCSCPHVLLPTCAFPSLMRLPTCIYATCAFLHALIPVLSQCSHRYNFLMFLPTCAPAHMCLPFPHAPSHMHLCDLRLPTCPHPNALTGITALMCSCPHVFLPTCVPAHMCSCPHAPSHMPHLGPTSFHRLSPLPTSSGLSGLPGVAAYPLLCLPHSPLLAAALHRTQPPCSSLPNPTRSSWCGSSPSLMSSSAAATRRSRFWDASS
ncbi:unnamed protein product [Closterium sp. Naga37s-1]|nr:unnamed protein product [Closterium sp. Naga37s-1]